MRKAVEVLLQSFFGRLARVDGTTQRYRELFQNESASWNHQHLFRRIAWRLQARAEGDLSEPARERAAKLA